MKNIKVMLILFVIFAGILSLICLINPPKMHKPLQISIIDYLIKINPDKSTTTIKKVTDYKTGGD